MYNAFDKIISNISSSNANGILKEVLSRFSGENYLILPGFTDVHVHLREPGFSYKETIKIGTQACARGVYATVFSMPNLKHVHDSV